MKNKTKEPKPNHASVRTILCQGIILILAAAVLQGCASPRTAWSHHSELMAQPGQVIGWDTADKHAGHGLPLLVWNF